MNSIAIVLAAIALLLLVGSAAFAIADFRHIGFWFLVASSVFALLSGACFVHYIWDLEEHKESQLGQDHSGDKSQGDKQSADESVVAVRATRSQRNQDMGHSGSREHASDASQNDQSQKWKPADFWMVSLTALLAFTGFATLVVFAIIMILQMRQTNQSIRLEQRPWLTIEDESVETPPGPGGVVMTTKFTTKNLGRTPAYLTSYYVRSYESGGPKGFPQSFDPPEDVPPYRAAIAPGDEMEFFAGDFSYRATDEGIEKLMDGKAILFVQFVVTYLDGFGDSHVTATSFIYSPKNGILTKFGEYDVMN